LKVIIVNNNNDAEVDSTNDDDDFDAIISEVTDDIPTINM